MRAGTSNSGSDGRPNSISTLARSAMSSVLSHASSTSLKSWRISAADFR